MANPELSVVVPSVNGLGDLVGCLEALEAQRSQVNLEVLVVDRLGEAVRQEVRRRFSKVRLIPVGLETTIPRMRAIAFASATGDYVAVIEDHVIVPDGWARALLDAEKNSNRAQIVGGSVVNGATTKLIDWAAFLCEYSHCIPPLPAGDAEWLTGNNVIYPRALLQKYQTVIDQGGWENLLHDAMKKDGVALVCHPEIVVNHKKHYTFGEYFSQRYLYARSYAGARFPGASTAARLAYGGASLALPPLLFYRTVSRVLSKGQHRSELMRSLPLLALFVTAWAAGEVVGYIAGPGDALAKVC